MLFTYILQLVCYFNVIFSMPPPPFNNKRKLPINNQNRREGPFNEKLLFFIHDLQGLKAAVVNQV